MRIGLKVGLILAAAIGAGCTPGTIDRSGGDPSGVGAGFGGAHIMPVTRSTPGEASQEITGAAAAAHLNYYGGPVLSHVKVVTLYWNSKVNFQNELDAFYGAVTNSAYMDWLSECNTPSQTTGRGS